MPYLGGNDGVPIYFTDQGKGKSVFLIHAWTMNHKRKVKLQ